MPKLIQLKIQELSLKLKNNQLVFELDHYIFKKIILEDLTRYINVNLSFMYFFITI